MLNRDRVLLVHPLGYDADAAAGDVSRIANIMPPIGLASIAACLERRGIRTAVIDCYARPGSDRAIRERLLSERPALIGLSCTTSGFLDGIRIAEMARATLPGIRTVFGGPHVSALKESLFPRFPAMDFAVVGEGEETLAELAERGGEDPSGVRGIVFREGGDGPARFTGRREREIELDTLPFPAYGKLDGFPHSYMLPLFNYPRVPNTSCISSRGCPYSCSYCDRSVFGRSFRFNSAEYLYEHLRHLKERFGVRHVNFYDDQFTFDRGRIEEFARRMIDRPLRMTFNCIVRAEHIDREMVRLMKAAGCWMMNLGIETGDSGLLAAHRRHADLDRTGRAIRTIKEAGIRTKGLLMMGLPGETEESVRRSMDYVFSHPIDDFNLTKFTPFPGSPIYEKIRSLGDFDEDWEKMDCMHFLFVTKGMTRERLEALYREFHVAHYRRPKILLGYVAMLWRSPDSWIRFARNLGTFLKFACFNRRLTGEGR
jgi:radical SAM superfamily enzyme YgiQ (UPF0313 family)